MLNMKHHLIGDIETLNVSGINVGTNDFYYVVTPNDTKPNIITRDSGIIDSEAMGDSLEDFTQIMTLDRVLRHVCMDNTSS